MGDKIIKFDKITKFNAVKIVPEKYCYIRHTSARAAEKNSDLVLYYITFKYRNRLGYRFRLFTKESLELSNSDPITILKDECLQWAQANYGEGG